MNSSRMAAVRSVSVISSVSGSMRVIPPDTGRCSSAPRAGRPSAAACASAHRSRWAAVSSGRAVPAGIREPTRVSRPDTP
ncbi:hypothetical protein [Nonomuraea sp. NPDC050310]|uniref:hypothetical protein n=1 Tax=unclassified Nonomuraea TaxID=2593643 RepID=UPI0034115A82